MKSANVRQKRGQDGPEAKIQAEIEKFLKAKDWLVRSTHGNIYQHGFPDLFCAHRRYGIRWIEVKCPDRYSFTPAQIEFFPMLAAVQVGVWILVAANEYEYEKLFQAPNWWTFLGKASVK